jgi:outer membrane receptor for ferrienterochelin and colicins
VIQAIPPGTYQLRVTMMGFKKIEKSVTVNPDEMTVQDFQMQETVIETSELIVTANKHEQSILETPNSVGVLTSMNLSQRNDVYLDRALQYASGVHFIDSQVNIRGSSGYSYGAGSRVLFLIDGVPVMPGDSGDIKWDIVPVTQVDHIEIIKGAGSALYGGSALGGVINVITKSASAKPVTNVRFSAGMYDKPRFPEWQWTNRLLHFDDVNVDHTRRLGRSEIFLSAGRHQTTGYAQNGYQQSINGAIKYFTKLNNSQNLTLSGNFQTGDYGLQLQWRNQRHALEVDPQALADYVASHKISANIFHNWIANKNFGLKTRLSYFRNFWQNNFHDNDNASTANRFGCEVQGDYQISQENSLIFGTEEAWDHVNSGLVGAHDQYVVSAYVQNERRLVTNVMLTAGLRYDYHHIDVGFEDSKFNPKIGLVWHAQSFLTFRASSGRGFRAASMSERFSDTVISGFRIIPNPGLKSETAWSHELGFNLVPGPFLYLDVAGFVSDYWDLIEPEPDANQVIKFINVTRARISGVETMLKVSPGIKGLSLDLGYTFMDPRDLDKHTVLGYRPKHIFNGAMTYTWGPVEYGVDYLYVARLDRIKVYPNDERVPQEVVNTRIAFNYKTVRLSFHANNVFNHNHTQRERLLMPIRHYVMMLSAAL